MADIVSAQAPTVMKGWLKKQSRGERFGGMMMKNWKSRFVVLEYGSLKYYEKLKSINTAPYGESLKGEMGLAGATLVGLEEITSSRVYIVRESGEEKDLLLEAPNAREACDWKAAVCAHIAFANTMINSEKEQKIRNSTITRGLTGWSDRESTMSQRPTDATIEGYLITPSPSFVVKTKKSASGEKVFLNVCEHEDVPTLPVSSVGAGSPAKNLRWPTAVVSPLKLVEDEGIFVLDVAINPSVLTAALADTGEGLALKDLLCQRLIERAVSQSGEMLSADFSTPSIAKKYKGSKPSLFLPSTLAEAVNDSTPVSPSNATSPPVQSSSVLTESKLSGKANLAQRVNASPASDKSFSAAPDAPTATATSSATALAPPTPAASAAVTAPEIDNPTTAAGFISKPPVKSPVQFRRTGSTRRTVEEGLDTNESGDNSVSEVPAVPEAGVTAQGIAGSGSRRRTNLVATGTDSSILQHQVIKFKVPYDVVRRAGNIVRLLPRKSASGKCIVACDARVMVVARREVEDEDGNKTYWVRLDEGGWLPEMQGKTVIVSPSPNGGQPKGALVLKTSMIEEKHCDPGWLWSGPETPTVSLAFTVDIKFVEDCVVRIVRKLSDVVAARESLLATTDVATKKTVQKIPFPEYDPKSVDLVADASVMLQLVEGVSQWLNKVVETVNVMRCQCKKYVDFLTPTEEDNRCMATALLADGSLGGAWAEELQEDIEALGAGGAGEAVDGNAR